MIEHLPTNLGNAIKYVWRCGLKATETPLRDLKSARWYTEREEQRENLFELGGEPKPKTEVVWHALARRIIIIDGDSTLGCCLDALLHGDLDIMIDVLDHAIEELEAAAASRA